MRKTCDLQMLEKTGCYANDPGRLSMPMTECFSLQESSSLACFHTHRVPFSTNFLFSPLSGCPLVQSQDERIWGVSGSTPDPHWPGIRHLRHLDKKSVETVLPAASPHHQEVPAGLVRHPCRYLLDGWGCLLVREHRNVPSYSRC